MSAIKPFSQDSEISNQVGSNRQSDVYPFDQNDKMVSIGTQKADETIALSKNQSPKHTSAFTLKKQPLLGDKKLNVDLPSTVLLDSLLIQNSMMFQNQALPLSNQPVANGPSEHIQQKAISKTRFNQSGTLNGQQKNQNLNSQQGSPKQTFQISSQASPKYQNVPPRRFRHEESLDYWDQKTKAQNFLQKSQHANKTQTTSPIMRKNLSHYASSNAFNRQKIQSNNSYSNGAANIAQKYLNLQRQSQKNDKNCHSQNQSTQKSNRKSASNTTLMIAMNDAEPLVQADSKATLSNFMQAPKEGGGSQSLQNNKSDILNKIDGNIFVQFWKR